MNLTQSSLAEFAGDLAARTPVPGGGGASAYAGALAASLASMAAAFTRPKDESVSDDVLDPIVERSRVLSAELVELVERDAEAYLALSRAYGMSRDDASRAAGRPENLVRVHVGLENVDTLIADLDQALNELPDA